MSETPSNYGNVSSPLWETDVFIVGGGPSALTFNYGLLRYQKVLAINDMCARLLALSSLVNDLSVAVISLDNHWVRRNRDFLSTYQGEKFVALPLETWPDCAGIPGVTYLQWGYASGLSDNPKILNTGGNSGYGAINLAYLKGAKRIFLIGFDMNPQENILFPQWSRYFRSIVPQLLAHRVPIWNLNPQTHIDAFPIAEIGRFTLSGRCGDGIPQMGARNAATGLKTQQKLTSTQQKRPLVP